jgi:hypothetical protein
MPIGTYFEYEFETGTTFTTSDKTDFSIPLTSGGVNFTWSVTDTAGNNFIGHFVSTSSFFSTSPPPIFDGSLAGTVCGTSPSTPQDQFALSFTDSNLFFEGSNVNPIRLDFYTIIGDWDVTFHKTGGGTSKFDVGTTATTGLGGLSSVTGVEIFITSGKFTHVTFTTSDIGAAILIDDFEMTVNCFCAETRLATPDGSKPVEELEIGDPLLLENGQVTHVKWVGRQKVETRSVPPRKINPICIKAGALEDNVPERDLYVSGDHAVRIDGYLVNASALQNGRSIFQVGTMPTEGFTYYHVETSGHELLLAENTPAESYVDLQHGSAFENAHQREPSRDVKEMNLPRILTARMLPPAIKDRLRERADMAFPLRRVG